MTEGMAPDPDYELWVLLRQTTDAIAAAREREVSKYGVTMAQAAALFVVKAIDGHATPAEIARWLYRTPHTVSALLLRMEKQGLIRRASSLDTRNSVRIELTEEGEEALMRSMDLKAIHSVLACLSQKERNNLRRYLEKMRIRAPQEPRPVFTLPSP